jgi:hypothetical protein
MSRLIIPWRKDARKLGGGHPFQSSAGVRILSLIPQSPCRYCRDQQTQDHMGPHGVGMAAKSRIHGAITSQIPITMFAHSSHSENTVNVASAKAAMTIPTIQAFQAAKS